MPHARILVVDDEQPFCSIVCDVLGKQGYDVTGVETGEDGQAAIKKHPWDLVVCDLRLPRMNGMDLLRWSRENAPSLRFLIVTAYGDIETAVEAMQLGALDYLTKPFLFDDLTLRVERLLERLALEQDHAALQDELVARYEPRGLVGESRAMGELRQLIHRVAPTNSNVLIMGESGTGKEVVARTVHRVSQRRNERLVTVNCAALPGTLLESELFGHTKGAFTGAAENKDGMFQAADGGTLFLDEIGAMPMALQSKILRAVETKEVVPVGTTVSQRADVRILAATSTDLEEAVGKAEFLDALFYRLNVFQLRMPPLRDRRDDIPGLVEHFIQRFNEELKKHVAGMSDEAMALLMANEWRGNVRELENAIERAMILTDGDRIEPDALPMSIQRVSGARGALPLDLRSVLRQAEVDHITNILSMTEGDKVKAAGILGISLSSLYRKLEEPDAPPEDSAAAPLPSPTEAD